MGPPVAFSGRPAERPSLRRRDAVLCLRIWGLPDITAEESGESPDGRVSTVFPVDGRRRDRQAKLAAPHAPSPGPLGAGNPPASSRGGAGRSAAFIAPSRLAPPRQARRFGLLVGWHF